MYSLWNAADIIDVQPLSKVCMLQLFIYVWLNIGYSHEIVLFMWMLFLRCVEADRTERTAVLDGEQNRVQLSAVDWITTDSSHFLVRHFPANLRIVRTIMTNFPSS